MAKTKIKSYYVVHENAAGEQVVRVANFYSDAPPDFGELDANKETKLKDLKDKPKKDKVQ